MTNFPETSLSLKINIVFCPQNNLDLLHIYNLDLLTNLMKSLHQEILNTYRSSHIQSKPKHLSPTPMANRLNVVCENLQKYIYVENITHILQHMSKQTEIGRGKEEIKVINEI